MSDFGAVYDYALQLEASIPPGTMAQFEAIRPGCMGITERQREEAVQLAAMEPEDRAKAEQEIAAKREEARAKAEETMRKRVAEAAAATPPAPTPVPHPAPAAPPHTTVAANNKK